MLDSANLTRSEGSLVRPYTEALFRGFIADDGRAQALALAPVNTP